MVSRGKAWWKDLEQSALVCENMLFCRMSQRYLHSMPVSVQYEMEENRFGGRKVVGQATMLAHWAQKVGGQLPALPNGLSRQCCSRNVHSRIAMCDDSWRKGTYITTLQILPCTEECERSNSVSHLHNKTQIDRITD